LRELRDQWSRRFAGTERFDASATRDALFASATSYSNRRLERYAGAKKPACRDAAPPLFVVATEIKRTVVRLLHATSAVSRSFTKPPPRDQHKTIRAIRHPILSRSRSSPTSRAVERTISMGDGDALSQLTQTTRSCCVVFRAAERSGCPRRVVVLAESKRERGGAVRVAAVRGSTTNVRVSGRSGLTTRRRPGGAGKRSLST